MEDPGGDIKLPVAHVRDVLGLAQLRLALAQIFLDPLEVGDVALVDQHGGQACGRVEQAAGRDMMPDGRGLCGMHPEHADGAGARAGPLPEVSPFVRDEEPVCDLAAGGVLEDRGGVAEQDGAGFGVIKGNGFGRVMQGRREALAIECRAAADSLLEDRDPPVGQAHLAGESVHGPRWRVGGIECPGVRHGLAGRCPPDELINSGAGNGRGGREIPPAQLFQGRGVPHLKGGGIGVEIAEGDRVHHPDRIAQELKSGSPEQRRLPARAGVSGGQLRSGIRP